MSCRTIMPKPHARFILNWWLREIFCHVQNDDDDDDAVKIRGLPASSTEKWVSIAPSYVILHHVVRLLVCFIFFPKSPKNFPSLEYKICLSAKKITFNWNCASSEIISLWINSRSSHSYSWNHTLCFNCTICVGHSIAQFSTITLKSFSMKRIKQLDEQNANLPSRFMKVITIGAFLVRIILQIAKVNWGLTLSDATLSQIF